MIKHISIQNFKSLADVKVDLAPFTVMIGKNGAGKSSFLQSLDVMTWLVRNASINETFERENITFSELMFAKAAIKRIVWGCLVTSGEVDTEDSTWFFYHAAIGKKRYVHVAQEWARLAEDAQEKDWGKIISEGRPFLGRTGRSVLVQEKDAHIEYTGATVAHSLLKDVQEQSSLYPGQFPLLKKLAKELAGFRHFQIWGPEPLRMESQGTSGLLSENGGNLASVIADLKLNQPDQYARLRDEISRCYPWLDDIELNRLGHGDYRLTFLERQTPTSKRRLKYSPSQMSDGFLRLLALTAIKYQRGKISILGYEEPENGLHPEMLAKSVELLHDIAKSGTQVIVTTHSPYLLDYLMEAPKGGPETALKVVVRGKDGATKILPVAEDKLAKARARGIGAGELWGMLVDERELTKG